MFSVVDLRGCDKSKLIDNWTASDVEPHAHIITNLRKTPESLGEGRRYFFIEAIGTLFSTQSLTASSAIRLNSKVMATVGSPDFASGNALLIAAQNAPVLDLDRSNATLLQP